VLKSQTLEVKLPCDLVYVLGVTGNELGGSAYYELFGYTGLNVPKVAGFAEPNRFEPEEFESLRSLYKAVEKALSSGSLASCHGIYRGGLGVHAAMVAMGGLCGLTVDLSKAPGAGDGGIRDDQFLFSESCGRFLVTVRREDQEKFERTFDGLPYGLVGEVTETPELIIKGGSGKELLRENIFSLRRSWTGND